MTTAELAGSRPEGFDVPAPTEVRPTVGERLGRFGHTVVEAASRAFGFVPNEAPLSMSEHFDHAEKINDLNPHFDDPRG